MDDNCNYPRRNIPIISQYESKTNPEQHVWRDMHLVVPLYKDKLFLNWCSLDDDDAQLFTEDKCDVCGNYDFEPEPLLAATLNKDYKSIKCLIDHVPQLCNIEQAFHCVFHAVKEDNVKCLQVFLENQHLNDVFQTNSTIAKAVLDGGNSEIPKFLINIWGIKKFVECFEKAQKCINEQIVYRQKERTKLHNRNFSKQLEQNYAIQHHLDYRPTNKIHNRVLREMVNAGYEFNDKNRNGDTPLIHAIVYQNVRAVKLIMKSKNFNINIPEKKRSSPFFTSLQVYNHKIVQLFLEKEDMLDAENQSFIWYYEFALAIEKNDVNLMEILVGRKPKSISIDCKVVLKYTPVVFAVHFHKIPAVKFLLQKTELSASSFHKCLKQVIEYHPFSVIRKLRLELLLCLLKAGAPIKRGEFAKKQETDERCFSLLQIAGNQVNFSEDDISLQAQARTAVRQTILENSGKNLFAGVGEGLKDYLPDVMISYLLYDKDL